MEVVLSIGLYSVLMLAGLTVLSGAMVYIATWLAANSEEPGSH